jgi:fluoride exporter
MSSYLLHPVVLLTVGGAIGTNARYWLGVLVVSRCGDWFPTIAPNLRAPLGILIINVTGSLLLGLFVVPLRDGMPPNMRHWWILFGVGFCGGYTTFSSFAVDTVELVRKYHQPGMAFLNVAVSVVVSCLVVWGAIAAMEQIHPTPLVMEVEGPGTQTGPQTPPPGSASDSAK